MKAVAAALLAFVVTLIAAPPTALAATYRVDDHATLPIESTALLRWRETAPSLARDNTLEGATAVAVRLNLARWIDQKASLYLVFPQQGTAALRASWTTQGRLLPGEITPGDRVLVYQGRITSPVIEDTLTLFIEADGSRLQGVQHLDFHFEIDTD
jgi:hypothetical protein